MNNIENDKTVTDSSVDFNINDLWKLMGDKRKNRKKTKVPYHKNKIKNRIKNKIARKSRKRNR